MATPHTRIMKGAEKPAWLTISGATASAPSSGPIASIDIASASQKPIDFRARLCSCAASA